MIYKAKKHVELRYSVGFDENEDVVADLDYRALTRSEMIEDVPEENYSEFRRRIEAFRSNDL